MKNRETDTQINARKQKIKIQREMEKPPEKENASNIAMRFMINSN